EAGRGPRRPVAHPDRAVVGHRSGWAARAVPAPPLAGGGVRGDRRGGGVPHVAGLRAAGRRPGRAARRVPRGRAPGPPAGPRRARRRSLAVLAAALVLAAGWSVYTVHQGSSAGTPAFGGLTDEQISKLKATVNLPAAKAKLAALSSARPTVLSTNWGGFPVLG